MAKITSKLQVSVPKAIAQAFGIRPGDHIDWVAADNVIGVVPVRLARKPHTVASRLQLFDQATERQKRRQAKPSRRNAGAPRGWKREELYQRGRAR